MKNNYKKLKDNVEWFFVSFGYKFLTLQLIIDTYIDYFWYYFNCFILHKDIVDRHDHFVPQFILKNFSYTQKKDKFFLYAYKRGDKSPFSTTTKNIANQIGFYNTKNKYTKKQSNFVDRKIYGLLEGRGSRIIKKIIAQKSLDISHLEECVLASFVGHLYTRTPSFRGQLKNFLLYVLENKIIELKQIEDKEFLRGILLNNSLGIEQQELIKYNYSKNKFYDVGGAENFMSFAALMIGDKISEELYYKKIHLLETKNGDFFVSSDNPVSIFNFKEMPVFPTGWDFKDKGIAICFPISPTLCLIYDVVGGRKNVLEIGEITSSFCELVNNVIMLYADKFVFSSENSPEVQKLFNSMGRQYKYK